MYIFLSVTLGQVLSTNAHDSWAILDFSSSDIQNPKLDEGKASLWKNRHIHIDSRTEKPAPQPSNFNQSNYWEKARKLKVVVESRKYTQHSAPTKEHCCWICSLPTASLHLTGILYPSEKPTYDLKYMWLRGINYLLCFLLCCMIVRRNLWLRA